MALIQSQVPLEVQLRGVYTSGREGTPFIQKAYVVTKPAKVVGIHMPQRAGLFQDIMGHATS